MTLRHDDVSNCAHLLVQHISRRMHAKMDNVSKNTWYVTPSPTYLEVPSLPEPSTALMFYKNANTDTHDNNMGDIKLILYTIYFSVQQCE